MSNLIQANELIAQQGQTDLRLIDARFVLADPKAGRKAYEEAHIPNAIFFDLDEDLSSELKEHGGRHPLADMQAFAEKLSARGIANHHKIIVYDDNSAVYSGRVWWMLKYAGHKNVQVLDGGLSAYLKAGGKLESALPSFAAVRFDLDIQHEMLVDMAYIKKNLGNPSVLLVDARGAARYRGEVEPIDKKAGHIPGAMNLPFTDNLQDGKYKPKELLAERFTDLEDAEEVIVYCGSGVSANNNLIAFEEAGIKGAKLYVGSWSDWSSYDDNPTHP